MPLSRVTRMFSGLMSLWTMFLDRRNTRPLSTSEASCLARGRSNTFSPFSVSNRLPPSMNWVREFKLGKPEKERAYFGHKEDRWLQCYRPFELHLLVW